MSEDNAPFEPASTPASLRMDVVQISDVGLVRSENQDFAVFSSEDREAPTSGDGRLMVVADGMGGHRGGATASRIAAITVRDEFLSRESEDVAESLRRAMTQANQQIFIQAQANPDLRGMGTTCSALLVRGDQAWIAHVGDSRIYLVRSGEIRQLTDDHSLVASMVREGLLTSQEAEVHPRRNVLQRSMGVIPEVDIDVLEPITVTPGDTFLLCSDGLHGVVKEAELREIAAMPIDDAASEYIRRALERGAPDNVTVIVARVESSDAPSKAEEASQPLDPNKTTERHVAFIDSFDDTDTFPVVEPVIAETEPEPAPEFRSHPAGTAPPAAAGSRKWVWVLVALILAAGAFAFWTSRTAGNTVPGYTQR